MLEIMKDKEMIEEMANCKLCYEKLGNCGVKDRKYCFEWKQAVRQYEQGYRKFPKDSVVLSKEEYDCLKRIEKAYDPFWFCSFDGCEGVCKECKDACEMSIFVKERKETAEKYREFTEKAINNIPHAPELFKQAWREKNNEIAKQFGVEIKE